MLWYIVDDASHEQVYKYRHEWRLRSSMVYVMYIVWNIEYEEYSTKTL